MSLKDGAVDPDATGITPLALEHERAADWSSLVRSDEETDQPLAIRLKVASGGEAMVERQHRAAVGSSEDDAVAIELDVSHSRD